MGQYLVFWPSRSVAWNACRICMYACSYEWNCVCLFVCMEVRINYDMCWDIYIYFFFLQPLDRDRTYS